MNRLRETKGISNQAKMRLASAYALIGKKSIATSILQTLGASKVKNNYYNYGSETRDKSMELETYVLLKDETKAIQLAKEISEKLSSNRWMSTQTTAYGLLAMSKYAMQNGTSNGIEASYNFNKISGKASTSKALFSNDLVGVQKENSFTITNKNKGVLYVRVLNSGILPVGEEKVFQKNIQASVKYVTKNGATIQPNSLSQGTNFVAEVTVKNTTSKQVNDIALTQFIPSGWEIINTRFTDFGNNTTSSNADYTDIRDATIHNYFSLKKYETKRFTVLLNASYLGKYYLPGIQVDAMYDNDYIARTKGNWIEVVK